MFEEVTNFSGTSFGTSMSFVTTVPSAMLVLATRTIFKTQPSRADCLCFSMAVKAKIPAKMAKPAAITRGIFPFNIQQLLPLDERTPQNDNPRNLKSLSKLNNKNPEHKIPAMYAYSLYFANRISTNDKTMQASLAFFA
jgi:hypothetical protein